jgi:carbonic anhydrase/acetyltransferase-like protein (isoleucine patch superfamily)
MMDNNSVLLPGSVLTSGSFVPSKQVWGGNPAKHIKDVHSDDIPVMKAEVGTRFELLSWSSCKYLACML